MQFAFKMVLACPGRVINQTIHTYNINFKQLLTWDAVIQSTSHTIFVCVGA